MFEPRMCRPPRFPRCFSAVTLTSLALLSGAASAQGVNWKQATGQSISVMLNQHPYQAAMVKKIKAFTALTGITVDYTVTPEENYFGKVSAALKAKDGSADVFMTGIYQSWDYATAGQMEPLDKYMNNPKLTQASWDAKDFFPGVLSAGKWNLKLGSPTGSGSQWVLPLGFESNTLSYNKKYFDSKGLKPPKTLDELSALAIKLKGWNGPGSYGLAVRGTLSWATIHPGYMTAFNAAGNRDFVVQGNKLVSGLDTPAAIAFTKTWADMIRDGGPPNWQNYTWYQASTDLGAGKAAMMFDADNAAFTQNVPGNSKEAGNIAWALPPVGTGRPTANEWIWGIGMNAASQHKTAAWLFMQYFTSPSYQLQAALNDATMNPPRRSVWANSKFTRSLSGFSGYTDSFYEYVRGTSIKFTPQPYFFETTTDWSQALRSIVLDKADPTATMKSLASGINTKLGKLRIGQIGK
ncbi:sugar ABC transporter substrate-binding protein [Deinococcus sp.]|uniref:ABC transporter substrate-binding protein n=1 Tax=Deinococcus sp. TaxID=47478 RepID=UPI0025EB06A6|nr:sugar ABC transporter substrate-binding protein [Deinococcus sp.]